MTAGLSIAALPAALARTVAAMAASTVGVYVWCLSVFAFLGYPPSETAHAAPFCLLLPSFSAIDRGVCSLSARLRPMEGPGHAAVGFVIAAGMAGMWVALLGENPAAKANLLDMALAGLAFGVPSGFVANESAKQARNIVDSLVGSP